MWEAHVLSAVQVLIQWLRYNLDLMHPRRLRVELGLKLAQAAEHAAKLIHL